MYKIFLADTINEDLQKNLELKPNVLLTKYDHFVIYKAKDSFKQEAIETVEDIKNKLKFHVEKNNLHEKQQSEIFEILNIPKNNQRFDGILSAIKDLKKYEENEISLYSNAQMVLES